MVNYDRLPAASCFFSGTIYQKMNEYLHLAGMSKRTVHGYLRAVRQLADFAKKTPGKISEAQLRRYFLYVKNAKEIAYGSIRISEECSLLPLGTKLIRCKSVGSVAKAG